MRGTEKISSNNALNKQEKQEQTQKPARKQLHILTISSKTLRKYQTNLLKLWLSDIT